MSAFKLPKIALTTDCVVFGLGENDLQILLIERAYPPHQGEWALPGGFVEEDEPLHDGARRELQEETGLQDVYLEQLYTFGDLGRDPRHRTVTVAYYALVKRSEHQVKAADDAKEAEWFPVKKLPALAFDHGTIVAAALERLRGKLRYQPIGFELLPKRFTLTELQRLYEIVLERRLDKRNFRKKIMSMGLLVELGETQKRVAHRAARLYRFDKRRYEKLKRQGFNFEL